MSDKSKRCVLFMTFRPSQRTLFMARRNWVPLALKLTIFQQKCIFVTDVVMTLFVTAESVNTRVVITLFMT